MSALPPIADIRGCNQNVRFVPIADIPLYLSSESRRSASSTSKPRASALACDQRQRPHFKGACHGEAIEPPFSVGRQSHIEPFGLCHGAPIHAACVAQIWVRPISANLYPEKMLNIEGNY